MSSVPVSFKITSLGNAALWNVTNTGLEVDLTHIQMGSGNRVPDGTETALVTPEQTAPIATGLLVSPTQIRMSAIYTGASAYTVREIGLWAGVPGGNGSILVAYWSQATGYLAVKSANVDFVFAHDMTMGEAVPPGTLTITADTGQSSMLAMMANHEAAADPHVAYATKVGVQHQTYTAITTAGTAPAYTGSASPAITANAAGQRFRVKFHSASAGAATLNLNSLGAKSLKIYDSAGAKQTPVAIPINFLTDVEYDGTDFVILNPVVTLADSGHPGYFRLSSGTILQWGVSIASGGKIVATFPLTFPNALQRTMTDVSHGVIGNTEASTVSGFRYLAWDISGAAIGDGEYCCWYAIGY